MSKKEPTSVIGKLQRRITKRAGDISFLEYVAMSNKNTARQFDERGFFEQAKGYYREAVDVRAEIKKLASDQRTDRQALGCLYDGLKLAFLTYAQNGIELEIPGYTLPKDFYNDEEEGVALAA